MSENLAPQVPTRGEDTLQVSTEIVKACVEAKARDVTALCVTKLSDLFDYFIVVSGRSDRQVQGICNNVVQALAQHGIEPLSIEGLDKGHWVVVDFGEVVLHIFYEPLRAHYDIESLWARAQPLELKRRGRGASLALKAA